MSNQPSPGLFFSTVNAYQRTAAIRTAMELGIFSAIGSESFSAKSIAQKCQTSERGMRILCDYLVILGFLSKDVDSYKLTTDSGIFLDQKSSAYVGNTLEFLLSDAITGAFDKLTIAVRQGGTAMSSEGTLESEHPVWVKFARVMAPTMVLPAQLTAQLINGDEKQHLKILDISAGHGLFGIAFAQRNPNAEIVALDWAPVLEVARENALKADVSGRFSTIAGSAFDVDLGSQYDLVLLPNFLHHFDAESCEKLLKKIYNALNPNGKVVTLEFIPNDDRITPPDVAIFSLTMLVATPSGDAYTFAEYESMFRNAGFAHSELNPIPPALQQVIISHK